MADTERTHTVINSPTDKQVYKGFRILRQNDTKPQTLIAAVWFEGEPEMYSLDNNMDAVTALRQYYVDGYGEQDYPIIVSSVISD